MTNFENRHAFIVNGPKTLYVRLLGCVFVNGYLNTKSPREWTRAFGTGGRLQRPCSLLQKWKLPRLTQVP